MHREKINSKRPLFPRFSASVLSRSRLQQQKCALTLSIFIALSHRKVQRPACLPYLSLIELVIAPRPLQADRRRDFGLLSRNVSKNAQNKHSQRHSAAHFRAQFGLDPRVRSIITAIFEFHERLLARIIDSGKHDNRHNTTQTPRRMLSDVV